MTRTQIYIEHFDYAGFWRNEDVSYKEAMCGLPYYSLFVYLPRNHYITCLSRI